MSISEEKKVDIWLSHVNELWRAVYFTPVSAAALFGAWYALMSKNLLMLSIAVLLVGIIIMILQFLIIRRLAQFATAVKNEFRSQLPDMGSAMFNMNGTAVARFIPLLVAALFILMLLYSVSTTMPQNNLNQVSSEKSN